jgi:hypothetical protein
LIGGGFLFLLVLLRPIETVDDTGDDVPERVVDEYDLRMTEGEMLVFIDDAGEKADSGEV